MLVFWEFLHNSFKQSFIYRSNFYLSIFSSILYLFIMMSVWYALYSNKELVNGITLEQMITFVTITFMLNSLVRSDIGSVIGGKVVDGSIALDLLKPINFKMYLFSAGLGNNLFSFLFLSMPVGIHAAFIWDIMMPDPLIHLLFFFLSIILGIILAFQINYVLGLTTFWFKTAFHITWIQRAFWLLFSGASVPLWFYPEILYRISYVFPFRYIVFEPIQIYLGKLTEQEIFIVFVLQLFWISFLYVIERVET